MREQICSSFPSDSHGSTGDIIQRASHVCNEVVNQEDCDRNEQCRGPRSSVERETMSCNMMDVDFDVSYGTP